MVAVPKDTPVTIPEVRLTVAIAISVVDQKPPATKLLSVVVLPGQTTETPVITPASVVELTVTTLRATAVPQLLVTVYDIVVVPTNKPVTIPDDEPTVAINILAEDHVPPATVLKSVVVSVGHTFVIPVMVPAFVAGLTVTTRVAIAVPQLFVTVYDIVLVPAITPLTMPVAEPMVATAVLVDDQMPPVILLLNDVVAAGHTVAVPDIVPASVVELMVTTRVAAAVPQLLETVYEMVDDPNATPVTIPVDEPTVAVVVLVDVQTPPVAVLLSVVVAAGQTMEIPEMVPAFGKGFTVKIAVATSVPQLLLTV